MSVGLQSIIGIVPLSLSHILLHTVLVMLETSSSVYSHFPLLQPVEATAIMFCNYCAISLKYYNFIMSCTLPTCCFQRKKFPYFVNEECCSVTSD